MPTPAEEPGRGLINAFFTALNTRHLDRCEAALDQLEALARHQPAYAPWCTYLRGILINERDCDWAEAEAIFSRLLETDLEPALHGRVLLALGRSYQYQGRWQEALHTYEAAVSLFIELNRPVDQAKAWKQMAICCRRGFTQGDFNAAALDQGITYCRRALDLLEAIEAPSPSVVWLIGSVWNTLGLIHRSLRQWDEAIACYQRDLALCRSLGDRLGEGLSYGNLGEVYQRRGPDTWPQALDAYRQALAIIREFDDRYEEIEVLANLGSLHREMGKPVRALEHYDRAIGLIEALRAGASSEEARAGFLATTVDVYANTVLLCLEMERGDQAFDYGERARSRAFLDVLVSHSPALARRMVAVPTTLAQVQAALPPDALLLEYFTTGLVEAQDRRPASSHRQVYRHRFPPARTLIFAITRQGFWVHDTGLSPNDLLPRRLDSVVERHFLKPELRRRLYDHLIAPVEPLLRGRRRLYLVPHGPLHYIPFQALIAPDGDTLLREGGPSFVYAPSATFLLHSRQRTEGAAPAPLLALGYNGQDRMALRFAEAEAQRVAQVTGGRALIGPTPKKAILYREAAGHQVLHISCHGEFDPDLPLASALYLGPGETLTAMEVLEHLRLRCDLVVLSACESGLSRVRRGDELIGLTRAFFYAGTSALLSTLWRVDERSTLILMEQFYQGLQAGLGFADALSRAQLYLKSLSRREASKLLERFLLEDSASAWPTLFEVLRRPQTHPKGWAESAMDEQTGLGWARRHEERPFADPYHWAPFILTGDRTLLGVEVR